jgi:hypothetical protein
MANMSTASDIPNVEIESEMQLIKVEIFDVHASSTILKVFPVTTAATVCEAIANKIDLSVEQTKFYNLILSLTWINDLDKQRYSYIRTLKPTDLVLKTFQAVLNKQQEKHTTSSHSNRKQKQTGSNGVENAPFNYQKHNVTARWLYKDMRTTPLDVTNTREDVSANSSSSDDEESIPTNDFTYLSQFERKGYLLRRSRKDPNIWRKRYCVLVDNLWCIDYPESFTRPSSITRRKRPKALCLKIGRHFRVYDSVQGFDYPHCIALQLQSTGSSQNIVFLRANSAEEQQIWVSDIQKRSMINSENQAIMMAEIIMCDEISSQADRVSKDILDLADNIFHLPTTVDTIACSTTPSSSSSLKYSENVFEASNGIHCEHPTSSCHSPTLFKEDYSSLIDLPIHRYPSTSLLHSFHDCHQKIYEMMSFIVDVHRYRQLHRLELSPSPRILWINVLVIYHKYIAGQILTVSARGREHAEGTLPMMSHNPISTYSMLEQSKVSPPHKSCSHSPSSSAKHASGTGNRIEMLLANKSAQEGSVWEISPNILISLHKRIFSNIRRQIAGFDVTSIKMLSLEDESFDDLSSKSTTPAKFPNATTSSNSSKMSQKLGSSSGNGAISATPSTSNTSGPGVFSWLFGPQVTATEATIEDNPNKNSNQGANRNPAGVSVGMSDQYISHDEIFRDSRNNSEGAMANGANKSTRKMAINRPMYQIKDIDDLPSSALFDETVSSLHSLLSRYFSS